MTEIGAGITFQQEKAQTCFDEVRPLLEAHWQEIAYWKDVTLSPDWKAYAAMDDQGLVRGYSVRKHGELRGYAVFFVRYDVHYSQTLMAMQDLIYLAPELRGQMLGARFMLWCEEQLKSEGVQIISQHVKITHDFGPLLKRLGYEPIDVIWQKRLDKES